MVLTSGAENYKLPSICSAHVTYSSSVAHTLQRHTPTTTQHLEYAHTIYYVIPSPASAHPCVLCLFVLYLVPSAICYPWLLVSHSAAGPSSLLFSGPSSSRLNKEWTDKHSDVLRVHDSSFRASRLEYCFTDPTSTKLCAYITGQSPDTAISYQGKSLF